MATERQIEANRRNSAKSCGPKTDEGKARSRANATKHGLAGVLTEVEAEFSPEFEARRAEWGGGKETRWAIDRVVAASLRIERCERAFDQVIASATERATLAWDEDRAVEAATIFGRLGKDPLLAARQLRTTRAGVELLIDAWQGLIAAMDGGARWSEVEASTALDLLGVAPELRSRLTPIDPFDDTDVNEFRSRLAFDQIDRLEILQKDVMEPLDAMDQRRATLGDLAMLSDPARLVLRYERDAWRRYRESVRSVEEGGSLEGTATPPASRPVEPVSVMTSTAKAHEPKPPRSAETKAKPAPASVPPVTDSGPSFEEERRAVMDIARAIRQPVIDEMRAMGLNDEDAWIDELERRIGPDAQIGPVTERSQFSSQGPNGRAMDFGPDERLIPPALDLTKR
jgi:hypothetical protein